MTELNWNWLKLEKFPLSGISKGDALAEAGEMSPVIGIDHQDAALGSCGGGQLPKQSSAWTAGEEMAGSDRHL